MPQPENPLLLLPTTFRWKILLKAYIKQELKPFSLSIRYEKFSSEESDFLELELSQVSKD